MIQRRTMLKVADNSGASLVQCIGFVGIGNRNWATIGDVIRVTIKEAEPRKQLKKGTTSRAVVVRQRKTLRRVDGSAVRFSENAVVMLKDNNELVGNRISGPIPMELKNKGFEKLTNLATELV